MRRLTALAALASGALWLGPVAAFAHSDEKRNVTASLDPTAEALAEVEVHLEVTLATQLVVVNRGDRPFEILDDVGVPFVRIDGEGAHANLASSAWYESYTAAGGPVPANLPDGPRWRRVSKDRSWGWFDPRLRTDRLALPHRVEHAKQPVSFGRWTIPVRLGGERHALTGRFRFEPEPEGRVRSRLTSSPEPLPGLVVKLLAGSVPGLYLRYAGADPLVVRGLRGEPFLRLGPGGVDANVRSETWRRSGRAFVSFERAPVAPSDEPPHWQRVSRTPRYSWIEPRAAFEAGTAEEGEGDSRDATRRWSVPIDHGTGRIAIEGVTEWVPDSEPAPLAAAVR